MQASETTSRIASAGRRVRALARQHPTPCFFAVAYALAWADWVPMALTGRFVGLDPKGPTHFPGLLAPLIAAFVVTLAGEGSAGARSLLVRMVRLPRASIGVWLAIASPALFFVAALLVGTALGAPAPRWADFGLFNGVPHVGPVGVALVLVGWNGFGEEVGWRGFALPHLQQRRSPLAAALLLGLLWAAWHVPMFFVVDTYRGLGPAMLAVLFTLGIVSGSVVLAWIYNRSGGSILAVALWHGTYNLFSGTVAARGIIAAVVSTGVMVWASVLVALELHTRWRHRSSVLAPHRPIVFVGGGS
jgi:membrane protease YdiL (CAAX protease family)